jgi:unsaturated chondroitin disaccharide hydrolase
MLLAAAGAVCTLAARPSLALDDAGLAHVLDFADRQLAATAAGLTPQSSPHSTRPDGSWDTVANTNLTAWTQGFFPGANWYLYDLTGDLAAKARADSWTRALEAQKTDTQTHDLGFKMYLSFGHAFRSTGDPYYKDVLLAAAVSLATRFDPAIGAVVCCDWNPAWHRPMVVDTMMNLELLLWAAKNGGKPAWRDMALSHASKTLADMVRTDGSTYHVVDYSTAGAILFRGTLQGYSDSSTWTRGQAWAIYGYTMVYRYTSDARMLAAARKVADYYLSRIGGDTVPNWDFDAPTHHKDSSAAAAVASALIELSGFVDAPDRDRYLQAAKRMLAELASPAYLAEGTTSPAVLLHGVGNLPEGKAIDSGLIYGDYYFIEALARLRAAGPGRTDAGVGGGPADAGGAAAPSPTVSSGGCASGSDAAIGALALLACAPLLRQRRKPSTAGEKRNRG